MNPAIPFTSQDALRELAARARAELEKRRATPEFKAGVVKQLRAGAFDKQLKVLDDPSRRIAVCCSRRAGKSELAAIMIAIELINAGHNEYCLFAARTLTRARQIIWAILEKINDDYGLGWHMTAHHGAITTTSGAAFFLLGVDDRNSIEKVRGSKYRLAICDEASTYEELLKPLIDDCIGPGTMDFDPTGRIIICGTPGYSLAGYWYSLATGQVPGWSHHYWTLLENPYMPNPQKILAEERERQGWDENEPTYRREYLGQWIADESALVYSAIEGRNTVTLDAMPQPPAGKTWEQWIREEWSVTVAADIGFVDAFAVVALGSPPHSKDCYFLECQTQSGLRADEQAAYIQSFRDKYAPERTVMDVGGAGKLVHGEFNSRYGHLAGGPAAPALKTEKNAAIGMMCTDLRIGRIKALIPGALALFKEWSTLTWSDDEKTKVSKHQANHCSDAGLYAWRAHRAYLAKALPGEKTDEEKEQQAREDRLKRAAKGRRR